MIRRITHIVYLFLAFAILLACNPAKKLSENQVFLRKQKIKIVNPPSSFNVAEDDMRDVLKQRINRKILVFRFNLGVYNLVNSERQEATHQRKKRKREHRIDRKTQRGKEPSVAKKFEMRGDTLGWRDWMANTVGEPPVAIDTLLSQKSAKQISIYLAKRGYFDNDVKLDIELSHDSLRATQTFYITPREAYRIRNITYAFKQPDLASRQELISRTSEIKSGDIFDIEKLDKERARIATFLNNRGYYTFSKDYLTFLADSTFDGQVVDMEVVFRPLRKEAVLGTDSIAMVPHPKYFIGEIYVHTDYQPSQINNEFNDTLDYDGIHFLYNEELDVKPDIISYLLQFKTGDLYQKDRVSLSYRKLSQLAMFQSANIQMKDQVKNNQHVLECHILLNRGKKLAVGAEAGVTNSDGLLGLSGNVSFKNRNTFGRSEALEFRITGAIESQKPLTETGGQTDIGTGVAENVLFNTFEIGPELTIEFPYFFPIKLDRFRKSNDPFVTLSAAFNYQDRPDFNRQLYQFRYSASFVENPNKGSRIFWDIWELSTIRIEKSEAFQNLLTSLNDDFLINSYSNHLISSGRVGWLLNNQKGNRQRRYYYNRISLESAGNLLRLGFVSSGVSPDTDGGYEIQGIQFAQYWKLENDFRYYRTFDDNNRLAFRLNTGVGRPGANLSVLPYAKSYYGGGSNGIRAWDPRSLGPGSYRDLSGVYSYNNLGEVKLETSLEYRFNLTDMLEGALFVDAGNIWLLHEDQLRPGSRLEFDTFLSEWAVAGGIGARLDFDFFLLRLDVATQLKDPAKVPGERWFWEPKEQYVQFLETLPNEPNTYKPYVNFNLGIGYPF
jgi:outer membrane translocation and assembly module TamA